MNDPKRPPARYALIGHPIAHSRSPLIHELFAHQTGQSLTYELIDAAESELETAVRAFRKSGGRGMNVTVPHKEAAVRLCDELGDEAHEARAVNTLSFLGPRTRGDNTDGLGFVRDLTSNLKQHVAGKRILILGAGGATRGIVGPLLAEGPATLVVANRTRARAERLAEIFAERGKIETSGFDELESFVAFDIVVNATSAGLSGEQPPFPGSLLDEVTFCYDLAYSMKPTPFVKWARSHGTRRVVQGWGMLVEQAAESFKIWRGVMPDTAPILAQMRKLTTS